MSAKLSQRTFILLLLQIIEKKTKEEAKNVGKALATVIADVNADVEAREATSPMSVQIDAATAMWVAKVTAVKVAADKVVAKVKVKIAEVLAAEVLAAEATVDAAAALEFELESGILSEEYGICSKEYRMVNIMKYLSKFPPLTDNEFPLLKFVQRIGAIIDLIPVKNMCGSCY